MGDSNDKRASGRQGGNFRKKSFSRGNSPLKKKTEQQKPSDPNSIRLNKYVANSGVCSRRDADIYISAGNVTVNGKPVTEMGYKVKLSDVVKFDGRLLNPEKKVYILLNKPKDFATTEKDGRGRRTAAQLVLGASKSKLTPIGKLEKATTGLIIFTNDGEMLTRLARPKNGLRKIYHVELNKDLRSEDLKKIREGITVEESLVRVADISYVENSPKREVGIELFSSRNNIVRRIFEHLEYDVVKLDRVVYAGLTKKDLPRGHWRHLTAQEVVNLGMIK
ncbi:23S rRNA pseudouridine2605 synthase [Saonia flava]|uniref:23S rRNA pseudouridine2605 synthase n=1 Tax=Saonia flava TaxID=523696 RepID=A0A846QY20_9FLAO|nr:pseudouridine synthase [Saonia flava]NJB71840.1 23S rRNA pseudouridine2605 synthase [Saonia flava]